METKPVKVLLIEDDPVEANLLQEQLEILSNTPFQLLCLETLKDGLERLSQGDIELLLLDLSLPDSHGFETFAKVHQHAPTVPVIVLSGLDDETLATRTVHAGAQDYLVKGQTNGHLLIRTMRYTLERARAEEALRDSEALYHSLVESLPLNIFRKDLQGRFTFGNRRYFETTSKQPAEILGKTDFDLYPRELAEKYTKDDHHIVATGGVFEDVERNIKPDGEPIYVQVLKAPVRNAKGDICGVQGIFWDVSDRKRAEEALAGERVVLRALIDALPDNIFVKDAQGRYVTSNAAHLQSSGLKQQEDLVGKTVHDLFPPEMADRYHQDDLNIMRVGVPLLNKEEPYVDQTGNHRWLLTSKVPLRGPQGQVNGLVGITRDITSRKHAETQLKNAHDDLARKKEELVQALAALNQSHEDLKAAQMQLIQAEKMLSVAGLAAGVAHEVKNPLAVLRMGVDYLSRPTATGTDENQTMVLKDMKDAIQRADLVIRDLLDFSASRDLQLEDESIHVILDKSLSLVRHEFVDPPIQIVRQYADGLPSLKVDRVRLEQVFINLIINAVHAMPEGGTLTVRTYQRQVADGEVIVGPGARQWERIRPGDTVTVAELDDTGTGIPEDKLTKIFDPFFTTKPTGKGTGLGLSVALKILELHNATMHIRNRPKGGARVTILFLN